MLAVFSTSLTIAGSPRAGFSLRQSASAEQRLNHALCSLCVLASWNILFTAGQPVALLHLFNTNCKKLHIVDSLVFNLSEQLRGRR